ncbi:MAG: cation transporter [Planctomycetes bacterium]|nr:cation transporter [Planctomycetota bacterium]
MTGIAVDLRASRSRAAALSVVVGVLMLVIKMGAFALTNSAAILSDALESVVHVGAVVFMYWSIGFAARPPDANHPYGHGKVEYFSVAFEGGMVVLAGLAVFWEVGREYYAGHEVAQLGSGLWLTGGAGLINLVLAWHLLRVGKQTSSLALQADARHVLSDVWTSLGAVIGVGLAWFTGDPRVDLLAAALLGIVIMVTGARLVRQAVAGLMDEADPRVLGRVVETINELREPEWLDVHNLRLRTAGDETFIDFHLMVPAEWSVKEAHDDIERLEARLLERLGRAGSVMIHLDYPKAGEVVSATREPFTVAAVTKLKVES